MIIILFVVLGLGMGSFVNALVWRLRQQETGKKSKKYSILKGRSMCPDCKHQLGPKDLVPLLSWLTLRGRCRYCKKPIAWQYPAVELVTTSLFVGSYLWWPHDFNTLGAMQFGAWLICIVLFMALIVYDMRWMILPDKLVAILVFVIATQTLATAIITGNIGVIVTAFWGVICTAGLFYALFWVSDGKWIGGGDVKMAVGLGILIGGPLPAVMMLFLASLGGTFVAIPLLARGKAARDTKLPFGPFLIVATMVVYIFGAHIIDWYERLLFV